MAREAGVKTIVLNHQVRGTAAQGFTISDFIDGVRAEFDGQVIVGEDQQVILAGTSPLVGASAAERANGASLLGVAAREHERVASRSRGSFFFARRSCSAPRLPLAATALVQRLSARSMARRRA